MMKVSSSSLQRPLILTNHSPVPPPKVFAYYSVVWEQNQSNIRSDTDMGFEINSCLYFQNKSTDNELEETRADGCGYVITYPPHIRPDDNLQVYNFDRSKDFLSNSKKNFFFANHSFEFLRQGR